MKLVCLNRFERGLRDEAKKVLDNPLATPREKNQAHKVMKDTLESARERFLRLKAHRALGPKPRRNDFSREGEFDIALDLYRLGLDKLAAEEVLDNPASNLSKRYLAKKIL